MFEPRPLGFLRQTNTFCRLDIVTTRAGLPISQDLNSGFGNHGLELPQEWRFGFDEFIFLKGDVQDSFRTTYDFSMFFYPYLLGSGFF